MHKSKPFWALLGVTISKLDLNQFMDWHDHIVVAFTTIYAISAYHH